MYLPCLGQWQQCWPSSAEEWTYTKRMAGQGGRTSKHPIVNGRSRLIKIPTTSCLLKISINYTIDKASQQGCSSTAQSQCTLHLQLYTVQKGPFSSFFYAPSFLPSFTHLALHTVAQGCLCGNLITVFCVYSK